MEYNVSINKLDLLSERIQKNIEFKDLLFQNIETVLNTPSMDTLTIQKIEKQILDIDKKIEALNKEKDLLKAIDF
jgi:hypothetical protein